MLAKETEIENETMGQKMHVRRAEALKPMHERRNIFLLPNAWDAGSVHLFATRGFHREDKWRYGLGT